MATQHSASEPQLVLGPSDQGRPTSAEEFAAAEYVEPWKYERIDGRLAVMAPDGYDHHKAAEPWRNALVSYQLKHPKRAQHVFQGAWARVDRDNDRIGDLGVYLFRKKPGADPPDRAPDLMFEFVSPGSESRERDYVVKRKAYHRFGISEYVVVDRFTRQVTVFARSARSYTKATLGAADKYASPLLPGLAIRLDEVL